GGGAGRRGVVAEFAGSRQRVPAPPDPAGLGVERREPTADAELAAGDTAVHEPVVVERRAGDRIAVLPALDGHLPLDLAGLHVERDHLRVELTEEQQTLTHRESTIDPAAAHRGDLLIDPGPVLPQD